MLITEYVTLTVLQVLLLKIQIKHASHVMHLVKHVYNIQVNVFHAHQEASLNLDVLLHAPQELTIIMVFVNIVHSNVDHV